MINDISTPATGPVQRSDAKLSKACITEAAEFRLGSFETD